MSDRPFLRTDEFKRYKAICFDEPVPLEEGAEVTTAQRRSYLAAVERAFAELTRSAAWVLADKDDGYSCGMQVEVARTALHLAVRRDKKEAERHAAATD